MILVMEPPAMPRLRHASDRPPTARPLAALSALGYMSFVRSRPYGRSGPSGPEAWSTSPSRVEERPLASFAAEPDDSIVPSAWSAPAAPYPSLPHEQGEG
jgi:hypothetical protein